MAAGFRTNIFDPILIIAQIISLFCFHTACLGMWLALANFLGGTHDSLDQIFDYRVSSPWLVELCMEKMAGYPNGTPDFKC